MSKHKAISTARKTYDAKAINRAKWEAKQQDKKNRKK